jgi:hypothetical protein
MPHRRFRAPERNGEVLAVPDFAEVPRLVEENRRRLDRADVTVGGLPLRELRALARREVLEAAREYTGIESPAAGLSSDAPLLIAGHQPELSHPGVWVKHFALNGLARKLGGTPLHLIVDNDTLKSTSLRFPVFRDHDPESVHLQSVRFDKLDGEVAYEGREVRDSELFRTFPERAASLWDSWGYEPLLPQVWQDALRAWPGRRGGTTVLRSTGIGVPPVPRGPGNIGHTFSAARRATEQLWGCGNLELPVSWLSHTVAFARFVWQILTDLPRFREVYNAAVDHYRRTNRIRSTSHPVPDLAADGDSIEAPFWGYRGTSNRWRAKPMVRLGESEFLWQLEGFPYGPFGLPRNLDWFTPHVPKYWVIRPRALTLTLFARVCLGDYFIHGIGGGKYDEVTDAIIRGYFGIEPPAYQVLSATLHLPLPTFPADPDTVRAAERRPRDLHWNPQRHLPPELAARPEVAALLREWESLAADEPPYPEHAARRERFTKLRRIHERLRMLVANQIADAERALSRTRTEARANAALRRRDFAWVLYPEHTLRPFLQRFLQA